MRRRRLLLKLQVLQYRQAMLLLLLLHCRCLVWHASECLRHQTGRSLGMCRLLHHELVFHLNELLLRVRAADVDTAVGVDHERMPPATGLGCDGGGLHRRCLLQRGRLLRGKLRRGGARRSAAATIPATHRGSGVRRLLHRASGEHPVCSRRRLALPRHHDTARHPHPVRAARDEHDLTTLRTAGTGVRAGLLGKHGPLLVPLGAGRVMGVELVAGLRSGRRLYLREFVAGASLRLG